MEKALNEDDATDVACALLRVSPQIDIFARLLKVPKATVSSIRREYPHSVKDRLLRVVDEFLGRQEPKPTWKTIVDALKNPLIANIRLAKDIEGKYGPFSKTQAAVSSVSETLVSASSTHQPSELVGQCKAIDDILREEDIPEIVHELRPVMMKTKILGRLLRLPKTTVDSIHDGYADVHQFLFEVIDEFVNQKEPQPTWKNIVDALRHPLMRESNLAMEIEEKYCASSSHNVSTGGEGLLTPDDAPAILQDLLPAKTDPYGLGFMLGLPSVEIEGLRSVYSEQQDFLFQIILLFLKNDPRPTWRAIVKALRGIHLPALAMKIEAARCGPKGDLTTVVDPSSVSGDEVKPKKAISPVEGLQNEIRAFIQFFNTIKEATFVTLLDCRIAVVTVVYMLLSAVRTKELKRVLEEKEKSLCKSNDHLELFEQLDPHWNYLSYDLLDMLLEKVTMINSSFQHVRNEMDIYKNDLRNFREHTELNLFCQTLPHEEYDHSPEFRKLVMAHQWPKTITLEDVELFRVHVLEQSYTLQKLAPMMNSVLADQHMEDSAQATTLAESESKASEHRSSFKAAADDEEFVCPISVDFLCPVTFKPLRQPHLTMCCGNHISAEIVSMLQEDNKPCPKCGTSPLSTVLNKHFQRQVRALHVFCHNKDRGCEWQGELAEKNTHATTCPMKDAQPLAVYQTSREEHDRLTINVLGASIFKTQTFEYKGKRTDFFWEDAGINLHFLAAYCVEPIKITVAVAKDIEEHIVLPPQYRTMSAASATYKIAASAPLPAPVRVRMEHCAIMEEKDSLMLMVAKQGPPYYFEPLTGVNFPQRLSHGEIEVQEFSYFRYFWNWLIGREMQLSFQVFYHEDDTVTFVVTKDLQSHINAAKDSVTTSDPLPARVLHVDDTRASCEPYTTDAIKLSVPIDSNGWHITPSFEPAQIKTQDIDLYQPGQTLRKIQLHMQWEDKGHPDTRSISIPIQGASVSSFNLFYRPKPQIQPPRRLSVKLQNESAESTALQKSYEMFMRGIDPANIIVPLFTNGLMNRDERDRATQPLRTEGEKLEEIYKALERRVAANPEHFHTLLEVLKHEEALKDVGEQMEGIFLQLRLQNYPPSRFKGIKRKSSQDTESASTKKRK